MSGMNFFEAKEKRKGKFGWDCFVFLVDNFGEDVCDAIMDKYNL